MTYTHQALYKNLILILGRVSLCSHYSISSPWHGFHKALETSLWDSGPSWQGCITQLKVSLFHCNGFALFVGFEQKCAVDVTTCLKRKPKSFGPELHDVSDFFLLLLFLLNNAKFALPTGLFSNVPSEFILDLCPDLMVFYIGVWQFSLYHHKTMMEYDKLNQ